MKENRVFSPNQVLLGTFFGGILAAIYFIMQNYEVLQKAKEAKNTLVYGLLATFVLIVITFFLPDNIGATPITIGIAVGAHQIVSSYQFTKQNILTSQEITFHSNWRVFFIAIVSIIVLLIAIFVGIFVLTNLGVISF